MYGYVYLTTNMINGTKYIGQHVCNHFDETYKGSGKLLRRAFQKYGWDNFSCTLVESANSKEDLDKLEIKHIKELKSSGDQYYNITDGGSGPGSFHSYMTDEQFEEVRTKISRALKSNPPVLSDSGRESIRKHTIERNKSDYMKEVCAKRNKERVWKQETLDMMSKRMSGNKINLGKKYINNGVQNKMVPANEVEKYLKDGWVLGIIR